MRYCGPSCALALAVFTACQDGGAADPAESERNATADAARGSTDAQASSGFADAGRRDAGLAAGRDSGHDGALADAMSSASDAGSIASDAGPSVGAPVKPSAGCGKGGRPANGQVVVANDHIYSFPAGYDGSTPLPAVFAFHAANNPIDQLQNVTRGSMLASSYVMVFPKSVGSGWVLSTDAPRLDGWLADLLENHCVDESRLFATGHSSGAQFIVQLLCRGERRFTAVAPVASSQYCASWDPIPALVIHGRNDSERAMTSQDADGRKDLKPYQTSNGCSTGSAAYAVAGCMSGGMLVDAGCVRFDGCEQPLVWCNHDDPNYAKTNHGWPCFANQAIFEFFRDLP